MKPIRVTLKGQRHTTLAVWDEQEFHALPWSKDYHVVSDHKTENDVRKAIGILGRVVTCLDGNHKPVYALADFHEFTAYKDYHGYFRLCVRANNWPGRAGYLAGIMTGYKQLTKRFKKKKKHEVAL